MNQTEEFLLGMGADTSTAPNLSMKLSISDIEVMSEIELENLGLTKLAAKSIKKRRPPIPVANLRKVLSANFYVCCVCKNRKLDVVVHHIRPYAQSRDHDCENLAVLCLQHHSEAHYVVREDAQNLTADKITYSKKMWEKLSAEIQVDIAKSRQNHVWSEPCHWDWVNFPRLVSLVEERGLVVNEGIGYEDLRAAGVVDEHGRFLGSDWKNPRIKSNDYFSAGVNQFNIALHIGRIFETLAERVQIFDLTAYLANCPRFFAGCLSEGDYVAVKAPFTYRQLFDGTMVAETSSDAWSISFSFDPYYCLTSTSRYNYQSSKPVNQTLFGILRSSAPDAGRQALIISPLGTSPTFSPHRPLMGGFIRETEPQ